MADTRINALTTATSSASDDFLPIDGTTNGTKKLSAFSPSFGGNATVGGTLTVNGTAGITIGGSSGSRLKFTGVSGGWDNGINFVGSGATDRGGFGAFGSSDALTYFYIGPAYNSNWFELRSTGLSIPITTDSTNKDTGCLVLEGGLGVEKNVYVGGNLVVDQNTKGIYSQGYVTVKGLQANYLARGTSGGWTAGIHFYSSNTDNSASVFHNPSTGDLQFYSTSSASDYNLTTDRALVINTSKQVQVLATTASTSTSSGALVVSGGVGVAGAIYAGGDIHSVGTNAALTVWKDGTPTKAAQLMFGALGDNGVGIRIYDGSAWSTAVNVGPLGTLTANASSNAFRIATAQTPASASATGTAGTICWDTSYVYVCTATNTWKRAAISTW